MCGPCRVSPSRGVSSDTPPEGVMTHLSHDTTTHLLKGSQRTSVTTSRCRSARCACTRSAHSTRPRSPSLALTRLVALAFGSLGLHSLALARSRSTRCTRCTRARLAALALTRLTALALGSLRSLSLGSLRSRSARCTRSHSTRCARSHSARCTRARPALALTQLAALALGSLRSLSLSSLRSHLARCARSHSARCARARLAALALTRPRLAGVRTRRNPPSRNTPRPPRPPRPAAEKNVLPIHGRGAQSHFCWDPLQPNERRTHSRGGGTCRVAG